MRNWLHKAGVERVVLEPTARSHRPLRQCLHSAGIECVLVDQPRSRLHAATVRQFAKTDRVDAAMLAAYGQLEGLRAAAPKPEHLRAISDLLAYRLDIDGLDGHAVAVGREAPAADGGAHMRRVGRLEPGADMLRGIDKRLHQGRLVALAALKVLGQASQHQAQLLGPEVAALHAGADEIPAQPHHAVQPIAAHKGRLVDPLVASGRGEADGPLKEACLLIRLQARPVPEAGTFKRLGELMPESGLVLFDEPAGWPADGCPFAEARQRNGRAGARDRNRP